MTLLQADVQHVAKARDSICVHVWSTNVGSVFRLVAEFEAPPDIETFRKLLRHSAGLGIRVSLDLWIYGSRVATNMTHSSK